jgi:flagella basal body P-ring formation protein FlgA
MRGVCFIVVALFVSSSQGNADILDMPVPSRTFYPGEKLVVSEFQKKEFSVNETASKNYVLTNDQLVKMEALRTLTAGKPVALSSIRRESEVVKGSQISTIYQDLGITIQSKMTALQDGAIGATITARNPATGQIVQGRVKAGGILEVSAP